MGDIDEQSQPGVKEPRVEFDRAVPGAEASSEAQAVSPGLAAMRQAMDKYAEALAELAK